MKTCFVYMLQLDKSVNCSRNRKMLEENGLYHYCCNKFDPAQCKFILSQVQQLNIWDSGRPALIVYDDLSKQAVATVRFLFIKKTTDVKHTLRCTYTVVY
jgi:F0F1-type ATP synthase alpha subunit